MKNLKFLLALTSLSLLAGCNKTQYTAYGLSGNTIIEFDTKTPSKVSATVTLGTVTSSSTTISDDRVKTIF
ncbi:hypothetical protein, partial [Klebsiella pneumoniae]|uniref:hypothetical protein n=1 Tax=Klebsiella pneumoniae TaxID=573 RepID=UPI003EDFF603